MKTYDLTRRSVLSALAGAAALRGADSEWVSLFDGKSLAGWKASENAASWKVADGCLTAGGPRSHLFYVGPVRGARFKNFELEAEVMSWPGANSGVFFHTAWQATGWPEQGFEVQIDNTHQGEGSYRERKLTGSLYGVRNLYKSLVKDNQWFRLNIQVRGKNVQVRLNGTLVVDYVEATPPLVADGVPGRVLGAGTFALQGHDPGSKVAFRSVRVRPLGDDVAAPSTSAVVLRRDGAPVAPALGPELSRGRLPRPPEGRADARASSGEVARDGNLLWHRGQLRPELPRAERRGGARVCREPEGRAGLRGLAGRGPRVGHSGHARRRRPVRLRVHRLHDLDRQSRPPHAPVDAR